MRSGEPTRDPRCRPLMSPRPPRPWHAAWPLPCPPRGRMGKIEDRSWEDAVAIRAAPRCACGPLPSRIDRSPSCSPSRCSPRDAGGCRRRPSPPLIPAPRPISTAPYQVGAYYFPGWPTLDKWKVLDAFPERTPLLGYYREGDPSVMDWQIKWAVEHGISFFAFDWYWDRGRRQLEHALHDGYFRARFRSVHEVLPPLGEPQPARIVVGGRPAGDDRLLDRQLLSPARLPHDRRQAGRDRLHPAGPAPGHGHRRGARGLRPDARAGAGGGAAGHLHHGGGAGEHAPRGARPRGL